MKKLFSTLILLAMVAVNAMADSTVYEVKDKSDFITAVKNHPGGYIKLTADINLSSDESGASTSGVVFTGTIDGDGGVDEEGHSIIYSIIGWGTNKPTTPLFKEMSGATITNVCIRSFRLERDTYSDDSNLGVLGDAATNCKLENVVFSDISVFSDDDNAGTIVGKATSCEFTNVKCLNCDVSVDGQNAGGLVGNSYNSKYYECLCNLTSGVFADGTFPDAYVGGIVGRSKQDTFQFCVNLSLVCGDGDRVGGITGYSENSKFLQCSNNGFVVQADEEDYLSTRSKILDNVMANVMEYYESMDEGMTAVFATFIGSFGLMTGISLVGFGLELAGITVAFTLVGAGVLVFAVGAVAAIVETIILNVDAHDELGGICGYAACGEFRECANYGVCASRDSYVGGIVGEAVGVAGSYCLIETCLNQGTVSGYDEAAGIAGYLKYAEMNNCLTTGKVSCECEMENKVCALDYGGTVNFSNNYYKDKVYNGNNNEFKSVTEEQLKSGIVAWWLNGGSGTPDSPWRQNLKGSNIDSCPTLDRSHDIVTADVLSGTYNINTADELVAFATTVNKGTAASYIVYIGSDIDMKGKTWTPIGTQEHPFIGLCFGGGHTISNLTCNSGTSRTGIFGSVGNGSEIHDINLGSGSSITGTNAVGGIVGCVESEAGINGSVRISGCMNYGDIKGTYNVGGILGAQYFDADMQLTIENCCNHGTITATNASGESGTISGYVKDGTLVNGCWNCGKVTGFDTGKSFVRFTNSIAINNCYQLKDLVDENSGMGQTGVGTYTTDELLNGTLCYNLNGGSNDPTSGLPWQYELGTTNGPVRNAYKEDGKAIYHSREVKSEFGTIVLPFNVKSDDYIKFYCLDNDKCDDTSLAFESVKTLAAGTPALFRVMSEKTSLTFTGADETFSLVVKDDSEGAWRMKGNLSSESLVLTENLNTLYYVSGDQIKSATNKITVGGYKAYIEGPSRTSSEVRSFRIEFNEGVADGIRLVPVEDEADTMNGRSEADGLYNMAGQRLSSPVEGINIIHGKKVFVK